MNILFVMAEVVPAIFIHTVLRAEFPRVIQCVNAVWNGGLCKLFSECQTHDALCNLRDTSVSNYWKSGFYLSRSSQHEMRVYSRVHAARVQCSYIQTQTPDSSSDHWGALQESQQLCPHQVVQGGENHEKHAELVMDTTSQPMKTAA